MSSVRQIAKDAGVSIGTVSRVLNNSPQVSASARDKVLSVAQKSGYVATVGKRSTTSVALLYTGELSLDSPFDAALMQGLSEALGRAGLDLLVLPAAQAERRGETIAQLLRRKVVRGAVVRTTADSRGRVHAMARDEVPFVVVAERFDDPAIACVTAPADPACRRAIEHLIHLGHTRIAITLNLIDDHDHAARLAVWRSVLDQHGLEASERLVLRVPAFQDAGAMALRQLMAMPERPTAVFCTDPLAAVGMCHEAQRSGVAVPDQLSVLGFDDTDQRMLTYPSLSAVCQDAKGLGVAACQALQRLLDHPGTADLGDGPACWFEPRDSTGPAPTPRT